MPNAPFDNVIRAGGGNQIEFYAIGQNGQLGDRLYGTQMIEGINYEIQDDGSLKFTIDTIVKSEAMYNFKKLVTSEGVVGAKATLEDGTEIDMGVEGSTPVFGIFYGAVGSDNKRLVIVAEVKMDKKSGSFSTKANEFNKPQFIFQSQKARFNYNFTDKLDATKVNPGSQSYVLAEGEKYGEFYIEKA